VPADAGYPYTSSGLLFEPTAAGTGWGATLDEAIGEGLLSAFAYQGLSDVVRCAAGAPQLALDALAGDAEVEFLRRAASHLDLPVTLLRLPGAEPAHAILAVGETKDGPVWTVGSAHEQRTAVVYALRDLVGIRQLAAAGETDDDGGVDLGNRLLADFDPRTVRVIAADTSGSAPSPPSTVADLVGRLRSTGRDAYVVDTTPRDLRSVGFFTVRVLLSNRAET
jgi:ribosomal protein S12 methylthiotransferase accessory factor YcaO